MSTRKDQNQPANQSGKLRRFRISLWSFLLDGIFASVIAVSFVFEPKPSPISHVENLTNAIITLLPMTVTVVSITLQVRHDRIFGVRVADYQSLRRGLWFGLIHMILISAALFLAELLIQLLDKPLTAVVAAGIGIVYAVLFALLELPLLMKRKRVATRIIRSAIRRKGLNTPDESRTRMTAVRNMILEYDIREAFVFLKRGDDKWLLEYLSSEHIKHISEIFETIVLSEKRPQLLDSSRNYLKLLDTLYTNIGALLSFGEGNYALLDSKRGDAYYPLRLNYLAHGISKHIVGNEDYEKKRLKSILRNYFSTNEQWNSGILINYAAVLSRDNAIANDFWFVSAFRDYDYPPFLYEVVEYPFVFIIAMILCFACNSEHVPEKNRSGISSFLDEKTLGLNSDGESWRRVLQESIKNDDDALGAIVGMQRILETALQIREHACDIYPDTRGAFTVDDSTHFGVDLVCSYWLEVLLYLPEAFVDEKNAQELLFSFSNEHKSILVKTLEERFLQNDEIIEPTSLKTPFLDFIFPGGGKRVNVGIARALINLKNQYNRLQYAKTHDEDVNETLTALRKLLDDGLDEYLAPYSSVPSFSDEDCALFSRVLRLEGDRDDVMGLLSFYLRSIVSNLETIVRSRVKQIAPEPLAEGKYDDRAVSMILSFRPDATGKNWRFDALEKLDGRIKLLAISPVSYLPGGTFTRSDGVLFCAKRDFSSQVRMATTEELNSIIDEEYIMKNGLYSFSEYKGSKYGSFRVTRDELIENLRERVFFATVAISVGIKVNEENVLRFEFVFHE